MPSTPSAGGDASRPSRGVPPAPGSLGDRLRRTSMLALPDEDEK